MGCTLNYTARDHVQLMKSIKQTTELSKEPLTIGQREQIRSKVNKLSLEKILKILSGDKNTPAYKILASLLEKSLPANKTLTKEEKQQLPKAFCTIIKAHPKAIGLFSKTGFHNASMALHYHKILTTAASIISKTYTATSGNLLYISGTDKIVLEHRLVSEHHHQADILVKRSSFMGLNDKTIGISAKYAENEKYTDNDNEKLDIQLEEIKKDFKSGVVHEFYFVAEEKFSEEFKTRIKEKNMKIAREYAKKYNYSISGKPPDNNASFDKQEEEKNITDFIKTYNVPQIDLCENVKLTET